MTEQRLDHTGLRDAALVSLEAEVDPTGEADLVWSKGRAVIAADPADFRRAFARLKKVDGYRWLVINRADLFAANALSIGSKAGIIDASGSVLKAADAPRRRV